MLVFLTAIEVVFKQTFFRAVNLTLHFKTNTSSVIFAVSQKAILKFKLKASVNNLG